MWPALIHGNPFRIWAAAVAVLFVIPALFLPASLGSVYRLWMLMGAWLGWINTRLILALGFFGLVTPIGIIRRMLGKDTLGRRFAPDLTTYRLLRDKRPGVHMRRQY